MYTRLCFPPPQLIAHQSLGTRLSLTRPLPRPYFFSRALIFKLPHYIRGGEREAWGSGTRLVYTQFKTVELSPCMATPCLQPVRDCRTLSQDVHTQFETVELPLMMSNSPPAWPHPVYTQFDRRGSSCTQPRAGNQKGNHLSRCVNLRMMHQDVS